MTYKHVVIVDDEYLIRELLYNKIDWEALGCQVVLKAPSASIVLDYIEEHHVDMIITDINMPFIDGMEMARRIKDTNPDIKVIVLTGYNEFDYAVKGIEVGVEGFILKPIDKEEVETVLKKAIDKINTEQKKEIDAKERIRNLEEERYSLEEEIIEITSKIKETDHSTDEESPIGNSEDVIDQVDQYIMKHMADSKLTLKGTAEHFFLNASYLSRTYKQRMGISFKERLFNLRMEKAVDLLQGTNMKVYEVANAVGIEDPNYFSLCFKKYKDMSVSDYKKSIK